MHIRVRFAGLVFAVVMPMMASAARVVDQRQDAFDLTFAPLEIGGPFDKRLAQTFTVGIEGVPIEVELPVQCDSGILIVEIFESDGGAPVTTGLWDRGLIEASSAPPVDPPEFRSIPLEELPPPPGSRFAPGSPSFFARVGDRFVMVLSNPTGRCTMPRGVAVDPYTRGHGFFDERPLPRGWLRLDGNIEPSDDLPFRTVMDADPPAPPCNLVGVGPVSTIPDFLPVCRCLEDESLAEQLCTLLHPSFFLIRRIPWPIPQGETFRVSWTLIPLSDLTGEIELKEALPKDLQASLKKPLVFRADHVKPGGSMTLEYKAVALMGKGGTLEVNTVISATSLGQKPDVQHIRSLIEVAPPK